MTVSIDAVLWKYSKKLDGTFPIKVRVTSKGDSKYYPVIYKGTRLTMSAEDWNQILCNPELDRSLKSVRNVIRQHEANARQVSENVTLNGKKPFSFDRFEREYKHDTPNSFFGAFDSYLDSLLKEGRIGTYRSYHCARVAFRDFLSKDIQIHELTPTLLKKFETYLLTERKIGKDPSTARRLGRNTVAIYMRTLKVIFNLAASENPSLMEFYPFARKRNDKNHYQIRTASGSKGEALSLEDLRKLIQSTPEEHSPEWVAKQFWLLSFYCQGMNFRDIAQLKMKDIKAGNISYIRHKTRNTELNEKPLVIPINAAINEILIGLVTGHAENDFAFGIIDERMNPMEAEKAVMQKIKITNKWLRRLCKAYELPPITTYWARHSYASQLKDTGVSVDFIQELLGHSNPRTTQNYLRKFDQERIASVNNKILELVNQATAH